MHSSSGAAVSSTAGGSRSHVSSGGGAGGAASASEGHSGQFSQLLDRARKKYLQRRAEAKYAAPGRRDSSVVGGMYVVLDL